MSRRPAAGSHKGSRGAEPRRESPARLLIATMVVSFSVSFAVLWWQQRRPSPPASPSPPRAATRVGRDQLTAPPPAAPLAASHEPESEQPQAQAPRSPAPPAHSYEGPDLPVVFGIINKMVYTVEDEERGAGRNVTRNVNEAIVSNSSDRPLTITVTELDASHTKFSQAQLLLPPGVQRHFGEDLGLKMLSGDELTLGSASYRDLIQQIP